MHAAFNLYNKSCVVKNNIQVNVQSGSQTPWLQFLTK